MGLHYQLPIWVDTSRLLASHNYNTPTAGRRGATLSATYLGGHLTFTSNHRHAGRQTYKTDRQTDRQNSNMTWIAIGLGEVRRKDERFTPAVPLWSRQWTSRCRRPRKLFYTSRIWSLLVLYSTISSANSIHQGGLIFDAPSHHIQDHVEQVGAQ